VASKDGLFIFKTPAKSAFLFAAAPGFEGDKITYSGQNSVLFTMKESTTRISAIGNPTLTLVGRVGTIYVYPSHMSCSGISFPRRIHITRPLILLTDL